MPKRFAVGTSLGLLARFARRALGGAIGEPEGSPHQAAPRAMVMEPLEGRILMANTWWVAPWGNDWAAGTSWQPFHTIQRAAQVANWGDTVQIRGGTYHETVHPWHSGVTFQAYNGENVTISGADPIGNWQWDGGTLYSSWMGTDRGEGNNQVFVDGQLMTEARWPNTAYWDPSHPTKEYAQWINSGWGWATIGDPNLSGGWTGAQIHIMSGEGWYGQTGTVTASGPGWLTFTFQPDGNMLPRSGNYYYLFGKFQGLDSPGEWYRDYNGMLYLSNPTNSNLNWHDVEVRTRNDAFDLRGIAYTTVRGVHLFAANIETDWNSYNTTIDGITASYISQFTWQPTGWNVPTSSGIELNGANSVLSNSVIGGSSGDGVYVGGSNVTVTHNTIHDVDYNAGDSAGIRIFGNNAWVTYNTVYNTGRDGIQIRAWGDHIVGNTVHDALLQSTDGGAIYTVNQSGWGGEISWNTVYNAWDKIPSAHPDWYPAVGIFLDNYSSNWTVDHNTVWNVDVAMKMNYSSCYDNIYGNSLNGWEASIAGNWQQNWTGTLIDANYIPGGLKWAGWGDSVWGNW